MSEQKNRKHNVIEQLLKNITSDTRTLLKNLCIDIIDSYSFKGTGIALHEIDIYRLYEHMDLGSSVDNITFTINKNKKIALSDVSKTSIFNNCTLIPSTDNEVVLIILNEDPVEKKFMTDLKEIANYISGVLSTKTKDKTSTIDRSKYQIIFQKSPTSIIILDVNGNVVEWSDTAENKFGYTSKGGPVSFRDFIHESEISKIRSIFADLYRQGENIINAWDKNRLKKDTVYREKCLSKIMEIGVFQDITKLYNRTEDIVIDAEYSVNLLVNDATLKIEGFLVTSNDITKRNVFRNRLEESEKKYRELFKIMPMFSMLIDTSGKTLEFNYTLMKDYGFNPETEGISYMDFIHESDQNRAASLFIDLYTNAIMIKNQWIKDKIIEKEECQKKLRTLGIRDEPLKMVNSSKDTVYETEFSANLWISEEDLEIKGALLSAVDVSERNLYRNKLEESERKYREIVEEKTRDIIFSLDEKGCFVTVNRNIREKLGYMEENVKGQYIVDILYKDPIDKSEINKETFIENLDKVLKNGLFDVRFKAECDHKFLGEPVTLQFKLDPIDENGRIIGAMGFASEISDDPLREYLKEEHLSYEIENKLTIADEVSYRITRNLMKFFDEGRISLLRLGLREMIVNAIEHGNLGITYEEKTVAQQDFSYQKLLRRRQKNTRNWNKKVSVEYRLYDTKIQYTICDEGPGFEYREYFEDRALDINEQMLQHGRGIMITKSVFDEMIYNDKGNEVNLIVHVKNEAK